MEFNLNQTMGLMGYFYDDWDLVSICNHPNTASIVYKAISTTKENYCLAVKVGLNKDKIISEYSYLNSNYNMLGLELFPKVYSSGQKDNAAFYIMEFLDGYNTFSESYLKNKLKNKDLEKVLDMFDVCNNSCQRTDAHHIVRIYQAFYIERLKYRLQKLKDTQLQYLIKNKKIIINEKEHENLPFFWEDYLEKLALPFFSKVYAFPGDAHFENILINKDLKVKIVDPNGAPLLPLVYDLGKILHSLHGGYDTIKQKNMCILEHDNKKFIFTYSLPETRNYLLKFTEEKIISLWGDEILKLAYLSEIFHYTSLILHHTPRIIEATRFYLRTVELIDDYKKRFF